MAGPELVEVTKLGVDYTILDCAWVPSSPRLLALGSSLAGQGRILAYSLSGAGLAEVARGGGSRALRCGTFRGAARGDRVLATGGFTGRLELWDTEDLAAPVDGVEAHDDLVNSVAGGEEAGRLVTGGRDGRVRVWDRRKLARSVVCIQGEEDGRKQDCWSVACSPGGQTVVAGFSNGDIRLFDLRQTKAALWETALPAGITSLELDRGAGESLDRLVAGTLRGGVFLWDLQTRHTEHGFGRTDTRLERSCVWRVAPCPQEGSVLAAGLQGGAVHLVTHRAAEHRAMTSADGSSMGTPGSLAPACSRQLSASPVTSLAWSNDRAGLLAVSAFDQTLRVCLVTGLKAPEGEE